MHLLLVAVLTVTMHQQVLRTVKSLKFVSDNTSLFNIGEFETETFVPTLLKHLANLVTFPHVWFRSLHGSCAPHTTLHMHSLDGVRTQLWEAEPLSSHKTQ
ncbi:hypothetical protein ACJMK2_018318 [Sinanodonta woodiana]|uniref:Secreted protein n=1 Tax=Sinanodonta woodiana TaxID=1069815 RepID=A0ABD3UGB3_SINWO